jgi:hypothetical protein
MLDVLCTVDVIVGTGLISVSDCPGCSAASIRLTQAPDCFWCSKSTACRSRPARLSWTTMRASLRISEVLPPPNAEARA